MLLRSIGLHLHREVIVLAKEILHRVEIVLPHIGEAAAVVVPVSAERLMNTVGMIRLVGSRAEPGIIVKFGRNGLRSQVGAAYPPELPREAVGAGYSHCERPAQQPAVDELFQRLHLSAQTIECVPESEPGVEAEDTVVALHSLHYPLALPYRAGHRLLAEHILAGLRSFHRHQRVPVRRGADMHHIYIGVVNKIQEVVICAYILVQLFFGSFHSTIQVILVHIAHRHQSAGVRRCEVRIAHTYASGADDALGKLVARGYVTFAAEHLARNYGEQTSQTGGLEELSSFGIHCYAEDWMGNACNRP